jgi:endogenous inhibitor of DNA gyrase (YacG/DUF329 family)
MERPCPRCGQPASLERENPDRPFCSARCRLIDLGAWLDGDYAIPGPPADAEEAERERSTSDREGQ